MNPRPNRIWYVLFALYSIAMLYLLFAREEAGGSLSHWEQMKIRINLIPFHTIAKQYRRLFLFSEPWHVRHSFINLFGNVVLFLPMGIFLPRLCRKLDRFWKVLLAAGLIVTAVELAQVITLLGRCDIDDLILNLTGTAVGYGLYKWIWCKHLPD